MYETKESMKTKNRQQKQHNLNREKTDGKDKLSKRPK